MSTGNTRPRVDPKYKNYGAWRSGTFADYVSKWQGIFTAIDGKPRTTPRLTKESLRDIAPEYVEGHKYTNFQLTLMADVLLRDDPKPKYESPTILFAEHLKERRRREIYVGSGTPDPSVESGMYWRTHPEGRSARDGERRTHDGFYR